MLGKIEMDQVKKVLGDSIRSNFLAGANLMIIKEGKEIFYHEDGLADREAALPIKRDTIFRLYSMTKPVTAVAAMILLERGDIDLYDPVSKYLPGFKNQVVEVKGDLIPAEREVTLKDLLSMTSGLVYGGENKAGQDTEAVFKEIDSRLLGNSPMSTAEIANRLGGCTLAFQPGAYWQYGTNADVMGAVIEVVSGKSFGEFLSEEIFKPLKMNDTAFWVPEEKRQRLAKTYGENGKGNLDLYTGNHLGIVNQMDRTPAFESGGAGLASTIDDYARFTNMLMKGGTLEGVQILRQKTVKYLTSPSLDSIQVKGFYHRFGLGGHNYGNFMRVMTDWSKAPDIGCAGEYGWDGWLGVYFCNCPEDDLTFIFMMQRKDSGTTSLTRKLRNIILSSCS